MSNNHDFVKERLSAYLVSEDFEQDISSMQNEYRLNGMDIPSQEQLQAEAVQAQRAWLENHARCEKEGHQLTETADIENGTSDLSCDRCGFFQHIQW